MKHKYIKSKSTILLTTTLILLSACATNKKRDNKIVESLELQNAIIDATIVERSNYDFPEGVKKVAEYSSHESKLKKVLRSIQHSNEAVIEKLKPTKKKGMKCGQNEGTRHEQQ